MIRVTKKGKKIKVIYAFICPRCGCEFNAEKEDVSIWSTHRSEVGIFHKYQCTCPNCTQKCVGEEAVIDES